MTSEFDTIREMGRVVAMAVEQFIARHAPDDQSLSNDALAANKALYAFHDKMWRATVERYVASQSTQCEDPQ